MNIRRFVASSLTALTLASGCAAPVGEEEPAARTEQAIGDYWDPRPQPWENPDARPSSNCRQASGDVYRCTNWFSDLTYKSKGYALFLNLDTSFEQRLSVTNTGQFPITAFVVQAERSGNLTTIAPGATTMMSFLDKGSQRYTVFFKPADIMAPGAATVEVKVVDGMTSPVKARMAGPTANCEFDAAKGIFQCKNVDPENVFNRGSYVLFRKLDAPANQKVRVKNTSSIPISAYSAQGFNVTSTPVRLEPGQSTILSRIDGAWFNYNALVKPEANVSEGAMTVEAQLLD